MLRDAFLADVRRGSSDDPVCRAVVDTVQRWEIPTEHFEAFLHSMRMDLTVTEYPTFADLSVYVHGSAAVIGREMVHVLGTTDPTDLPEALENSVEIAISVPGWSRRSPSASAKT